MRMPKSLGFVAAGFLALSLGVGMSSAMSSERPSDGASQTGKVANDTTQQADSNARTEQKNVNKPFSLFSVGGNNGEVKQYNDADTKASSDNWNDTNQSLNQDQDVKDHGRGKRHGSDDSGASQYGNVDNSTDQSASSNAETDQANVNAPISIFSVGSNNGNVDQSNNADTKAKSQNGNETNQSADQNQSARGGSDGARQSGRVENSTDQTADSYAKTKQVNVNAPISLFSVGSNNGDVHQGNDANTNASSSNSNSTDQFLGQSQSLLG